MDGNMKFSFWFLLALVFSSCSTTIDIQRKIQSSLGVNKMFDPSLAISGVPIEVEAEPPPPVIIERPIYIPEASAPSAPALQGRSAVQAAARTGILEPRDYSNATMLYDYDRDFVYELYCQPFRLSDVTLQPGEKTVDVPFVSDSERWMLGAGVSYEGGVAVQHIYVKPTAANLVATLIINTDQRVYHLILRSYSDVHMPVVRWRYRDNSIPQIFVSSNSGSSVAGVVASGLSTDPRYLSFDYRIKYGFFQKPRWLPTLVYDDGQKTYVTFPDSVLQTEMPAVFEDRADVLNYRVNGNLMIIDKLIEKITVRLADKVISIEKKRGS
jgi:type IV secretion system protein VirB9